MGKKEKQAKNQVAEQINAILELKHKTPLPDDILIDALAVYTGRPLAASKLLMQARRISERIRKEIPDTDVLVRSAKSLSIQRRAAAVSVYGARPVSMSNVTYFGAYFNSLVFKPDRLLFHSAIEPAMTNGHLYERIISRSQHPSTSFSEAQGRLSVLK